MKKGAKTTLLLGLIHFANFVEVNSVMAYVFFKISTCGNAFIITITTIIFTKIIFIFVITVILLLLVAVTTDIIISALIMI